MTNFFFQIIIVNIFGQYFSTLSNAFLIASSSIFPNFSTIDNIYQSIIDLWDDKDCEDCENQDY